MNIEENYEKLYSHWVREFEQNDLTELNQEKFDNYCRILREVENLKLEQPDKLKEQLLQNYKKNFEFLFNDLLKIRKIKIINFALNLKEIDPGKTFEAERLFYKNLLSSIKGYDKIKRLLTIDEKFQERIELQLDLTSKLNQPEKIDISEIEAPTSPISISKEDRSTLIEKNKKNKHYKLIRFIKKCPPLVGIDLINYGPFKKEDIAFLPEVNANILLFEKFAEEIDI